METRQADYFWHTIARSDDPSIRTLWRLFGLPVPSMRMGSDGIAQIPEKAECIKESREKVAKFLREWADALYPRQDCSEAPEKYWPVMPDFETGVCKGYASNSKEALKIILAWESSVRDTTTKWQLGKVTGVRLVSRTLNGWVGDSYSWVPVYD